MSRLIDNADVQSLIALYTGPLKNERFPEVDADTLTSLGAQADEKSGALVLARTALDEAEKALSVAREAVFLAEKAAVAAEEALLVRAQKALGYAKIYAADKPDLLDQCVAIRLPTAAAEAGPKRASVRKPRAPKAAAGESPAEGENT